MRFRPVALGARLRSVHVDRHALVQALVALALNSSTSIAAGIVLGSITGTFRELPGLLVMVPAAIGLRGNVFSALGSRLSTAIHTGQFRFTFRRGSLVGDNIAASLLLTVGCSALLAVVAKGFAVGFGVVGTISVLELTTISVVGGLLASVVVLAGSMAVARLAVRFGWDLDNLVAPIVSTMGDVLTLPALWLAAQIVLDTDAGGPFGALFLLAGAVCLGYGLANPRAVLRDVTRQSLPVLVAALVLSTLAGLVIEKRLDTFDRYPVLLVLVPAFVSSAGALGGVLTSQLSTKLHLGLVGPTGVPSRLARADLSRIAVLALPVYLFNAAAAHAVGTAVGHESPGLGWVVAAALIGAVPTIVFVALVGYYGSIAAFRVGVDPDTYGVPLVTSSVDFTGAVFFLLAVVALGIAT